MTFNIVFPILKGNPMSFIPQSSIFIGIIPAMILLYIALKDWQGHYTEKTLFIMFIFGIISGFIVSIVEVGFFYSALVVIIIFPFLEQIIKMMILNLRRYHEKQSTVMYGLALGLGFGSIYPPASMMILAESDISSIELTSILLGSIGLLFLHGATGALIGYGVYKGKIAMFYLYSVSILITANFLKLEYIQWLNLLFGIALYWYIHKKIVRELIKNLNKRKRVTKTSKDQS